MVRRILAHSRSAKMKAPAPGLHSSEQVDDRHLAAEAEHIRVLIGRLTSRGAKSRIRSRKLGGRPLANKSVVAGAPDPIEAESDQGRALPTMVADRAAYPLNPHGLALLISASGPIPGSRIGNC
jgi:hypothetical protein